LLAAGRVFAEAKLEIHQPLARTAYQTNEWISFAVVRSDTAALPATELALSLTGADGTRMTFSFALPAVAADGADARRTEHLHLNGWLLRPGHYTVEITAHGAKAATEFDLYPHIRKTSYKLINWGRANKPEEQLVQGEESLGFNLFYGHYGADTKADFIRAGVDFMACCVMSGGHQMDLRTECDWSDPYVVRGGTARVVRRAFIDRTRPNVFGVHFYDEPGLTWGKDPATGEMTPHAVPSQAQAYKSAFGQERLAAGDVKPDDPEHVARWKHWATWKLGFMDAAWKDSQFGVSYVRPDYLSVTQSQYGFSAFTDGYYFNVTRCMPVVSGHGGYDDYGPGYFNPSFHLEIARARDFTRPCWYLPTWYGSTPAQRFRLEQYLSFMTNIQGMISPPDIDPFQPLKKPAAEGVVESNQLMARLGTIFTTMPVTRPPVAMLFSLSNMLEAQVKGRKVCYAHDTRHGRNNNLTYLAGKMLQQQFLVVVDEDIVDGTLAAHHKAVVLTSIDYLDPNVVKALEEFAARGGLVLLTADCAVKIQGAANIGVTPALPDQERVNKLVAEKNYKEAAPFQTLGKQFQGAEPLAKAIKAQLDRAGIKAFFECDNPGITATRQGAGDIEYLFAVNAACDWNGPSNNTKAAVAAIALPADNRAVYDAVRGGPVAELKDGKGQFRFGAGQMRVFARTARPVGGVKVSMPQVERDYTAAQAPLRVEIAGALLDNAGGVLSGSAPLRIVVRDPLGNVRYDLYRATRLGAFSVTLPLALNDPPGAWNVTVRELLANTESATSFHVEAVPQCGALAGATWRAVHFGNDRDNIFRFFRTHQDVTLVTGTNAYNAAAAERLAETLKPWGVRCKTVAAAEVNKRRELPPEAQRTWVGHDFGRVDPQKYGIGIAGFAVDGPAVLLGTPEDNPLIKFAQDRQFLPYKAAKDVLPGRGRGYIAWQRDCVGHGQDSITLIAYDAAGMAEAVGSAFEAASGIEPLTPLAMPQSSSIAAVSKAAPIPEASVAWTAVLPDRAVAIVAADGGVSVTTYDGTVSTLDAAGKMMSQKPGETAGLTSPAAPAIPDALKGKLPPTRIAKYIVAGDGLTAVGYWGGTLQVFDAAGSVKTQQHLGQDITGIVWCGGKLIAGLADGRVIGLEAK
jgi:hypothetical protein